MPDIMEPDEAALSRHAARCLLPAQCQNGLYATTGTDRVANTSTFVGPQEAERQHAGSVAGVLQFFFSFVMQDQISWLAASWFAQIDGSTLAESFDLPIKLNPILIVNVPIHYLQALF